MGQKKNKEGAGADTKGKPDKHLKIAVIDIGSNSVRLVALKVNRNNFEEIGNNKHICELGKLDKDNNIPEKNQKKAFAAFKEFAKYIKSENIEHVLPVATAAARNANNGREFVEKAEKILGQKIRLLSAQEEAKFAAFGVIASRLEEDCKDDIDGIVADLGGGSLDLALVNKNEVIDGISTKLGTLVIKEQDDQISYIRQTLEKIDKKYTSAKNLYVIGGSWRAVRKTWAQSHEDKEIKKSGFDKPNLKRVPVESVSKHLDHILALRGRDPQSPTKNFDKDLLVDSRALSEEFPNLSTDRANRIFDASLLLRELINKTTPKNVVFVESGLREGLVYNYFLQSVLTFETAKHFFKTDVPADTESVSDHNQEARARAQINSTGKPAPLSKKA